MDNKNSGVIMSNQDERATGQAEDIAPLAAPVETKNTDKASEKAEIVTVENPAASAAIKETDKGHWGRGHTLGFFSYSRNYPHILCWHNKKHRCTWFMGFYWSIDFSINDNCRTWHNWI